MKTKKSIKKALFTLMLFASTVMFAQTTISGSVVDSETQESIPGANIIVVGSNTGTIADFDGNFTLNTSADLPLTIEVSYIGFGSQTVEVTSTDQNYICFSVVWTKLKRGHYFSFKTFRKAIGMHPHLYPSSHLRI